jgi:hypothetical protein
LKNTKEKKDLDFENLKDEELKDIDNFLYLMAEIIVKNNLHIE